MDSYVPPAERGPELVPQPAAWSSPKGGFPHGPEWEVTRDNAAVWGGHRFEGHFSERVLRLISNPEGHPLFELRLDLLEYETLFCRFVGIPHNPQSHVPVWLSVRYRPTGHEEEPEPRSRCRPCYPRGPKLEMVAATTWLGPWEPVRPAPWTPPTAHLLACLQASCRDYAEGLAMYLRPGREHWGDG